MKKKVLFQSDSALAKTGFGRNAKALLSYLYKTGKYDIVSYCCGSAYSAAPLQRTPWKSIGTLPDDQNQLAQLNQDPGQARMASYGAHLIDKVVKEEKPDVYIAVQDIWGVEFAVDMPWFDKISSVIWTPLDSLLILLFDLLVVLINLPDPFVLLVGIQKLLELCLLHLQNL